MTTPNPLIAAREDTTMWYSGLGIVESVNEITHGIESGSWIDTSLGAGGAGLDTLGVIVDPVGSVFAWGVAWLMEHLEPLSEALDSLAGDPDQIAANSRTWHNVAMRVTEAATDMRATVLRDIEEWSGPSAEAYQFTAQDQIDVLRAIAKAASAIGNGIHLAGVLVAALREVVRDLIFEGISTLAVRLPMWLAEVGFTLGAGTPWVTGQVATLVAQWVKRIGAFLKALIDSFRRLAPLLSQLDELIAALQTALRRTTQRDPADLGGTRNPDHLHGRSLTPEQLKSIRSFEARITEHQAKLEAYKADPWAYDNQGILERAPNDAVRQSIINGRIRHLEREIQNFQSQIDNLKQQGGTR